MQFFPAGTATPCPSLGPYPSSPVARGLLPARASRGHFPGRPPPLRPTWVPGHRLRPLRVPGHRLQPHRHASPDARLPATCPAGAAASITTGGPFFTRVPYLTNDFFSAGNIDTAAEAIGCPACPCCDAGVPPTAPSPTPASCASYGDATRGWYPAAPGSCGDARGLSGTLFRPRGLARPSLAPHNGRGVRGPTRQPDMGSGASSVGLQHRHRQLDLDSQVPC